MSIAEKKEQDYILLILNCEKYKNKAYYQRNTWLPRFLPSNIIYFHIIGKPDLESEYVFDYDAKYLYVKTNDNYLALPQKIMKAYYAIHRTYKFKYVFKTDDDQILVNPRFFDTLLNLLVSKTPRIHYGGYIVDIKLPYVSKYYHIHPELPRNMVLQQTRFCTGRFYFLSDEAVLDLLCKRTLVCREYLEDYAIGYNLGAQLKGNMLMLKTNTFFTDIELSDYNPNVSYEECLGGEEKK